MRREAILLHAPVTTPLHLLSVLATTERSDLFEFLMQAVVRMGDILALALLVGALSLIVLMVRECLQPEPTGDDFATNLFNKIEEFRNDFQ